MKDIRIIIFTIAIITSGFICTNAQTVGTNVGNKAPELMLPNENGDTIKLSSLQGKYILIDFWASWCGPCRRENPSVMNAYNEYKDANFKDGKTFDIVGVSLDMKKDKWVKAIEDDKLTYSYHVSDLKGWTSSVIKQYKIKGIPTNYLIDGNGIIVAKNLRGEALEYKLKKLKRRK